MYLGDMLTTNSWNYGINIFWGADVDFTITRQLAQDSFSIVVYAIKLDLANI